MFKKIIYMMMSILCCNPLLSMEETNKSPLDLEGNGDLKQVELPFQYYQYRNNDRLTLIHQGGYRVYNIKNNENDVAIIGPLRPCIGISVTDGDSLIVFHKHSTNSLESMEKIIRENLNIENVSSFHARIYTTRDDLEWTKSKRQEMHGGNTHLNSVKQIKDFLEKIGIVRSNIPAELKALRKSISGKIVGNLIHADGSLGRYDLSETCVSVRLNDIFGMDGQIKFSSIDPYTEDVFGYRGTEITAIEYMGPKGIANIKNAHPDIDLDVLPPISYDDIPQMYYQQSGQKDGYTMQRGICERRMNKEEQELYLKSYGISEEEVINKYKYNSLDFFQL